MAAVCTDSGGSSASTSNVGSYASASFTPVLNDLLVVFCVTSGQVQANPTCTDSLGAVTFTLVQQALFNTSASSVYVWVANQLAAASARTVTVGFTASSTGAIVQVCRVSGMTKLGPAAVRQSAATANGASGATPVLTFPGVALTANPTLCMEGIAGTITANPSGYTRGTASAQSYSTPTTQGDYVFENSGDISATITYTATAAAAFGLVGLELDTSAGSNFSQSLSGSITSTAALTTKLSAVHSLSASVVTSASIIKQINHSMSAAVVSSAAIIKQTAKSLSASVTTSAALAFSKVFMLAMSASVVCSGALQDAAIFAESFSASTVVSAILGAIFSAASTARRQAIRLGLWEPSVKGSGCGGVEE